MQGKGGKCSLACARRNLLGHGTSIGVAALSPLPPHQRARVPRIASPTPHTAAVQRPPALCIATRLGRHEPHTTHRDLTAAYFRLVQFEDRIGSILGLAAKGTAQLVAGQPQQGRAGLRRSDAQRG
jgi:hypothetical protein